MALSQLDFSIALVLGIAPALAVLYWSIRGYDIPFTRYRLFDDRRLFGGFAVGLIFGSLAAFVEVNAPAGLAGTIAALAAFFLFEESFKTVWLNRRTYRGRFDTTFYGVAVGVGIAATLAVASVLSSIAASPTALSTPETLALLVLFCVSWSLVHADTGVLIGFGASRGETLRPLIKALLVRYAHGAILLAFFLGAEEPWSLISAATSIVFAAVLYHYVYTVLLPATLPDDVRREMKREKRRARRAKA
jgi:hypothetical protein